MEGIDSTFDAVVFIGYHAKAGTPNAILEHTSTGNVVDFSINGVSLPEGGYNALVAGMYGVPVVFVAGDRAGGDQREMADVRADVDAAVARLQQTLEQRHRLRLARPVRQEIDLTPFLRIELHDEAVREHRPGRPEPATEQRFQPRLAPEAGEPEGQRVGGPHHAGRHGHDGGDR